MLGTFLWIIQDSLWGKSWRGKMQVCAIFRHQLQNSDCLFSFCCYYYICLKMPLGDSVYKKKRQKEFGKCWVDSRKRGYFPKTRTEPRWEVSDATYWFADFSPNRILLYINQMLTFILLRWDVEQLLKNRVIVQIWWIFRSVWRPCGPSLVMKPNFNRSQILVHHLQSRHLKEQ